MTTATRSVAVVATRLPDIDRRALSQAWYSALHLPASPGGGASPIRFTASSTLAGAAHASRPAQTPALSACSSAPTPKTRAVPAAPGPGIVERRGPAGDLARRIERAILRHSGSRPLQAATISVSAGDGRVALLVRTDGATTRIVALCAPHLRDRVDRALAHARFGLAASGLRLEVA